MGTSLALNLTCDAHIINNDLARVVFISINKVKDRESVTPLAEIIPASQQPMVMDNDLLKRSKVTGSLDVTSGEFLTLVVSQPSMTDGGRYRCSISYVDGKGLGQVTSDVNVGVSVPATAATGGNDVIAHRIIVPGRK